MRKIISNPEDGNEVSSSHTISKTVFEYYLSGNVEVDDETFLISLTVRDEDYVYFTAKDKDGTPVEFDSDLQLEISECLDMSPYQEEW